MVKIRVVNNINTSNEIIQRLLLLNPPVVCVSCKGIPTNKLGTITTVAIATLRGDVYIFDVKKEKDFLIKCGLARLLQAVHLIKVFHDVKRYNAVLRKQFGVRLQNIFDTQTAYSLLMEYQDLPARLIQVGDLYCKYGGSGEELRVDNHTRQLMIEDSNFWARRPISKGTQRVIAMEALPLVSLLYDTLKREIEMCRLTSDFIDICKDSVRPASSRARSRSRTRSSDSDSGDNMQVAIFQKAATPTRSSSPILKLSKTQERLLKNTIPLHGQW